MKRVLKNHVVLPACLLAAVCLSPAGADAQEGVTSDGDSSLDSLEDSVGLTVGDLNPRFGDIQRKPDAPSADGGEADQEAPGREPGLEPGRPVTPGPFDLALEGGRRNTSSRSPPPRTRSAEGLTITRPDGRTIPRVSAPRCSLSCESSATSCVSGCLKAYSPTG